MRFILSAFFCLMFAAPSAQSAWEKGAVFPASEAPIDLAACRGKSNCFYAASPREVFVYQKENWQALFSVSGLNDSIIRIYAGQNASDVWIQTRRAIYRASSDFKKSELIYESHDPQRKIISFYPGKEALWVGTLNGIWVSFNLGKTWEKRSDLAGGLPVPLIRESSIGLFFGANENWQFTEDSFPQTVLKLWDRYENDPAGSSEEFENSDTDKFLSPALFYDFIETEEAFYLATAQGIYQSRNGLDWQALPQSGLRNSFPTRLGWNKKDKTLVGISEDGFFSFDPVSQTWSAKNEGLAKTNLGAFIPPSAEESAWVSGPEGLWIWQDLTMPRPVTEELGALFNRIIRLEPSAREIHKRVVRYSNTSNAKINRWHAESRLSALVPRLSLGKDVSYTSSIDLDRGGTNDPDFYITGPNNWRKAANLDLVWNMSDFIYSTSQTSIDSRNKLMVDQRNSLLSEATRIFYERRRLQAEIIYAPAQDEKSHFERLLRLEELTSLLDALTDGYFSNRLERIYREYPEMEELWKFQDK